MNKEEQWALRSRKVPFRNLVFDRQMRSSISILVIGILITLLIWLFERHSSKTSERDQFLLMTDVLTLETETKLSALGDTLRSSAAVLASSERVVPTEWQEFSSMMGLRDPPDYLRFLGYSKIFKSSTEFQSFISTTTMSGAAQPSVSPPETYPAAVLITAHPLDNDVQIVARISSLLSNPHFANALTIASKTRDPISLETQPPFQNTDSTSSAANSRLSTFLFPLFGGTGDASSPANTDKPIDELTGLVIAELDLRQFAQDILKNSSKFLNNSVHLEIRDATEKQALRKQPQLRRGQQPNDYEALSNTVELNAYGQPWLLQYTSTPQFRVPGHAYIPAFILAPGFIISLLLSILLWSINRRKSEAVSGEQRLLSILKIAPDTIIITDRAHNILIFNQSATRTFGYSSNEVMGQHISMLTPLPDRNAFNAELRLFARAQESARQLAAEDRVYGLHKSGRQFPIEMAISKVWDDHDCFYTIVGRDISARRASERKIDFLIQEIQHRSKNMASLFLAMARESAAAQSPGFIESFADRVAASSACNDLFTRSGKHDIALETVIVSQIQHFAGAMHDRIDVQGPECIITLDAAQSIGMTIHELAMNACKYGALSVAAGRVRVFWQLKSEYNVDYFYMEWVESGGPPVEIPTHAGFGTTVIRSMLEFGLEATIEVAYPSTGLVWCMRCKAEEIFAASHSE